ncbi:MAG TPA: 3-deoxy-7-phosphoheptulonate synthase [Lentisphaeria bacterium]|nr:MAG: 3-deoxy-7-phosphoheptulonate synthase [Lentisphaerae bacterium GWF2_50_93]HCE46072.1 3-deoxy-7-phosphoheptulonate synthase [Lentisphaeria bacterium]
MIIVFKPHTPEEKINEVSSMIVQLGYEPRIIKGVEHTVIGAVGDEKIHRSLEIFKSFDCVEAVIPIQKRYKLASREYHEQDSIVMIGDQKVGAGNFQVIAGPCAIESREQLFQAARDVYAAGGRILRGGAYKPRTSPYDFQGLGEEGLRLLKEAKEEFNMPVVTEVLGVTHVKQVAEVADCLQIGARNCQNYHLLEHVANAGRPVLLKRGMATTVEEWLSAAEYLVVHGCPNVILCERGIRTFETATRSTLDLGAVAVAKKETHLPVIVDPSHAAGKVDLVLPLARAAVAVGADGIIVETHPDPVNATSDAAQQIPSGKFGEFMNSLRPIMDAMKKK